MNQNNTLWSKILSEVSKETKEQLISYHDRALEEMNEIFERGDNDVERNHSEADDTLLQFLAVLGLHDLVDAFEEIEKWFA